MALLVGAVACATTADARPVKIARESKTLQFSYEWPSQAAAIPALRSILRSMANAAFRQAQDYARDDQEAAKDQKHAFNQHYYTAAWESAGETPRLFSLQASIDTFAGGAHPNHEFKALIWDRSLNRQVSMSALFVRPADFTALTQKPFCTALDAERKERREGEVLEGIFSACPKFSELAIAPADTDKDGRFDTIQFVAPPYIAGPYVEGEYSIALAVTGPVRAALKPEYRSAFELQRQ